MGYRSGWSKQMREYQQRNQGTSTHVPATAKPWIYDDLGVKRWKDTGEKWVKGKEQTEGYTRAGGTWNVETETWEKKWKWIELDDPRIPSQAEIDFYESFDEEGNPTEDTVITQAHLDETGLGEGGEGLTTDDVGEGGDVDQGEDEDDPDYTSSKGYAQRTEGYNPFLQIKKKTKEKKRAFSRGSLRVKKPKTQYA